MNRRPLRCAAAATAVLLGGTLGTAAPASADDDTSTVTVTVTGGLLQIAVATNDTDLGKAENTPDGTTVSGKLGQVTVSDRRNGPAGSGWVATAVATELESRKGSEIKPANIAYASGPVRTEGTVTVQGSDKLRLNQARAVVTASEITGNNSANWTPTITVTIPPDAVAGTYSGTITHSVS